MKQSRRDRSDFFDEDRYDHKHSKRTGHQRDKLPGGEMGAYHRSSANERDAHKNTKQSRHSRDKHATDDMARHSSRQSRSRPSRQTVNDAGSDSSDEILIKGRASRHSRRNEDKYRARQLKSIDKTQKGSLGLSSSSSSGQKTDGRYGPVASKSDSPPITSSRQSQSRSSVPSKTAGISVNAITSQVKGITKSFLSRRSNDSHKSPRSRSRNKHEKRDKHGKKRESVSKFLAPLTQRWACYQCGKLRSNTIEQRHPLKDGERMQPNWCGKCRVHGELYGRAVSFRGQRHYCWGCGIVRSTTYHLNNPIGRDKKSTPNYCKPCREASPVFDYNLREASEMSSVISVREAAFCHQVHEAELSDIVEEQDEHSPPAPGKENRNPESAKKLKVSMSFMLENCSNKVRTISDETTDGSLAASESEALHLDQERAHITSGGGCRLSDSSYQPPTVESLVSETCKPEINSTSVTEETLSAMNEIQAQEMKNSHQSIDDTEPIIPNVPLANKQQRNSDGSIKKKVHWSKQDAPPMTVDSNASDSAYCSGHPSDLSYKSAGSRRSRRDPGDVSAGPPLIQEGKSTTGDPRSILSKQTSSRRPESREKGFGEDVPVQETFGISTHEVDADTNSSRRGSSQSSNSVPATPPESFAPATTSDMNCKGKNEYESFATPWADAPEIPNFSRPDFNPTEQSSGDSGKSSRSFLSPPQQRAKPCGDADPVIDSGFGARPGYMQDYGQFHSAAHFGDSTHGRDYSGFQAPGEAYLSFQSEPYVPTAQHDDWPSAGYPSYNDYHNFSEGYPGGYSGSYGYGDSASFPSPNTTTNTPFDFSDFGQSSNANGGDGTASEGEKFVRSKKKRTTTAEDTPRPRSWHLYDDGDHAGSVPNATGCEWRKDGRTTVHHSGGGKLPNEGMTVQILSIQEIDSDEELIINTDNDDFSDLDTVVGDDSAMKSICAG